MDDAVLHRPGVYPAVGAAALPHLPAAPERPAAVVQKGMGRLQVVSPRVVQVGALALSSLTAEDLSCRKPWRGLVLTPATSPPPHCTAVSCTSHPSLPSHAQVMQRNSNPRAVGKLLWYRTPPSQYQMVRQPPELPLGIPCPLWREGAWEPISSRWRSGAQLRSHQLWP